MRGVAPPSTADALVIGLARTLTCENAYSNVLGVK